MNRIDRRMGKWCSLLFAAALVAASGQACPPDMMTAMPTTSLSGLWTGRLSGSQSFITQLNAPDPPNPNPGIFEQTIQETSRLSIQFTPEGLPVSLPLPVSAFEPSFELRAVTAFNVGETQSISFTEETTTPDGATDTATQVAHLTTTLSVTESTLLPEHFRVVYATTQLLDVSVTGTAPGFMEFSQMISSTGSLTVEATAVGGFVTLSVVFNNNGTLEFVSGAMMLTGNGFAVGSLSGLLAAD